MQSGECLLVEGSSGPGRVALKLGLFHAITGCVCWVTVG
jgi:hypothetical protein